MDFAEVIRTTAAVRLFRDEPVADQVLFRVLDTARFAASGANLQGWHVIVVQDEHRREALKQLYGPLEQEFVRAHLKGQVAFSPGWVQPDEPVTGDFYFFSAELTNVPILLLVTADLSKIAFTDSVLERPSLVGGASIYPFAYSILLAARNEGVGGVMTTLLSRVEPAVAEVCGIPQNQALAAMIALGYPQQQVTRLSRHPVHAFTTVDSYDGPSFQADARN